MSIDGAKTSEICDATGCSPAMTGRFRKVAKMLVADPRAEIDFRAEKLSAEYVSMMRELVSK